MMMMMMNLIKIVLVVVMVLVMKMMIIVMFSLLLSAYHVSNSSKGKIYACHNKLKITVINTIIIHVYFKTNVDIKN